MDIDIVTWINSPNLETFRNSENPFFNIPRKSFSNHLAILFDYVNRDRLIFHDNFIKSKWYEHYTLQGCLTVVSYAPISIWFNRIYTTFSTYH